VTLPIHRGRKVTLDPLLDRLIEGSKEPYTIVRREKGLLFVRHPKYGQQVWTLSTKALTFKYRERGCALCRRRLGFKRAYHPITNMGNRMHRICEGCGEKP